MRGGHPHHSFGGQFLLSFKIRTALISINLISWPTRTRWRWYQHLVIIKNLFCVKDNIATSWNSHNSPVRSGNFFYFYRLGNWGSERWNDLCKGHIVNKCPSYNFWILVTTDSSLFKVIALLLKSFDLRTSLHLKHYWGSEELVFMLLISIHTHCIINKNKKLVKYLLFF